MISAKIIADSINPFGNRLTTFVVTFNRWILAEMNTHRALSRNSASSRAVPVQKMIERILHSPAEPVHWGKNQAGMQADQELSPAEQDLARAEWKAALNDTVKHAQRLMEMGIHKQIVNRLMEPFAYTTTIISATEWGNFFNLRAHPDAQPEFQELAYKMLGAYVESKPVQKQWGEWHLPFADQYVEKGLTEQQLLKIVVARCARVSYLNFDGDMDHEKDYALHDQLVSSGHWSPFEHAARALGGESYLGNFRGWKQYRHKFRNENQTEFDPHALLARRAHA